MRAFLRALSTVLIVAGSLLLLDAGLTLVWQEPISAFLAKREQNRLGGELNRLEKTAPSGLEQRALAALGDERQRLAFLARTLRRHAGDGDPLGRIKIPKIGANFVFVNGTNHDDLTKGPGLYEHTPLPGIPGSTAIAGHRTTYLAPFRHIDELKRGDAIEIETPYADFTYRMRKQLIVLPTDTWVIRHDCAKCGIPHDNRLILSACTPLYSASHRIIVVARLTKIVPRGAARRAGSPRTLVEQAPGLAS